MRSVSVLNFFIYLILLNLLNLLPCKLTVIMNLVIFQNQGKVYFNFKFLHGNYHFVWQTVEDLEATTQLDSWDDGSDQTDDVTSKQRQKSKAGSKCRGAGSTHPAHLGSRNKEHET